MTKLQMASAAELDPTSDAQLTLEAASPTPILITEQEVLFSTAAAVPVQPTTTRRWIQATHVIAAGLHRMFLTTADTRPARRHHPERFRYLEDALMAREMHRL